MVAGRHNLTRRALLGAAAGVPLAALQGQLLVTVPLPAPTVGDSPLLTVPSPVPPPGGDSRQATVPWLRALAAFRRAEARLDAFRRYEASLPPEARAFPACEPLEERFGDLDSARLGALRRMLRASAPDLPALALKIELTIDNQAWELTGAGPFLAALKADAHRLASASANSAA